MISIQVNMLMRYIQCDPCAVCQAGWYGNTCNRPCPSSNCKDSQCNQQTGLCTACPGNFDGDYCTGKLKNCCLLHKYTLTVGWSRTMDIEYVSIVPHISRCKSAIFSKVTRRTNGKINTRSQRYIVSIIL